MNTSIEQKYLIGFGGISWERLAEYVDQYDKVGRNQDRIFAEMPVENQSEKLPIYHCLKCACFPVESGIHSGVLISQTSADSSCLMFEAIPHL